MTDHVRAAARELWSEHGREVVHLAAGAFDYVQRCALCAVVLVDNRPGTAAPYYAEGARVVAYSGTTWATSRKVSCRGQV